MYQDETSINSKNISVKFTFGNRSGKTTTMDVYDDDNIGSICMELAEEDKSQYKEYKRKTTLHQHRFRLILGSTTLDFEKTIGDYNITQNSFLAAVPILGPSHDTPSELRLVCRTPNIAKLDMEIQVPKIGMTVGMFKEHIESSYGIECSTFSLKKKKEHRGKDNNNEDTFLELEDGAQLPNRDIYISTGKNLQFKDMVLKFHESKNSVNVDKKVGTEQRKLQNHKPLHIVHPTTNYNKCMLFGGLSVVSCIGALSFWRRFVEPRGSFLLSGAINIDSVGKRAGELLFTMVVGAGTLAIGVLIDKYIEKKNLRKDVMEK